MSDEQIRKKKEEEEDEEYKWYKMVKSIVVSCMYINV